VQISGYMYKFQDLTPISGHFRTNFKISGILGQCPGLPVVIQNLYQCERPPLEQIHTGVYWNPCTGTRTHTHPKLGSCQFLTINHTDIQTTV